MRVSGWDDPTVAVVDRREEVVVTRIQVEILVRGVETVGCVHAFSASLKA